MKKKKLIRLTSTLTALALSLTLTAGCEYKKRDKFYFSYNLKGEAFINKNDYISSEFINNYYLIEIYHTVLNRSMIYIANDFKYTSGVSKYTNVFTNNKIAYNPDSNDYYEFINIIPLIDILEEYNLIKDKYTYEDMQNIYKIIKEKYIFNEYKPKTKVK